MRKEVLQLRQDHRTLALMLMVPVLWLVLFGYAATFDVKEFNATLLDAIKSEQSEELVDALADEGFHFDRRVSTRSAAKKEIEAGRSVAALIIESTDDVKVLIDGSNVVTAQGAARSVQRAAQKKRAQAARDARAEAIRSQQGGLQSAAAVQLSFVPEVEILYNPDLESADFMIPGLIGMIILFVGGLMTSLGVVRERERGTLEQLIATPLRPLELVLGKVAPYALLALVDLLLVVILGFYVFGVPFRGDIWLFIFISLFFLIAALGIGLLVSTVSNNQQQAMQTSVFILFPQFLLAGIIFPLEAIPWAVRWISYALPLTYFVPVARGIFLKGVGLEVLWPYALALFGFAVVMLVAAALRFRIRGT